MRLISLRRTALGVSRRARHHGCRVGVSLVLAANFGAVETSAMPSGIATPNCTGCHDGGAYQGELALIPSAPLVPGERAEFTLRVTEQTMRVAGYFVTADQGTFAAGTGNRATDGGIVHSRPVLAANGNAEATFYWTPPLAPGGTDFGVYVVAANDDSSQMGDKPASAMFSYVWGCEGVDLYEDIDGDGFGSDTGGFSLGCEARPGWSTLAGDCNDLWASIHPGAEEHADGRDEDCDGEVDEGIEITTWYIDRDGDGFGYGAGVQADVAPAGYVGNRGDCDDEDATISPLAVEVCDGRDNDCNGKLDDGTGVSITCGIGLCARTLEVCDRECVPGTPQPEVCDGLDDDCDGEIDEDVTCPEGMACIDYSCVAVTTAPSDTSNATSAGTALSPRTDGAPDVAAHQGASGSVAPVSPDAGAAPTGADPNGAGATASPHAAQPSSCRVGRENTQGGSVLAAFGVVIALWKRRREVRAPRRG